jgi:hypothetical protein
VYDGAVPRAEFPGVVGITFSTTSPGEVELPTDVVDNVVADTSESITGNSGTEPAKKASKTFLKLALLSKPPSSAPVPQGYYKDKW